MPEIVVQNRNLKKFQYKKLDCAISGKDFAFAVNEKRLHQIAAKASQIIVSMRPIHAYFLLFYCLIAQFVIIASDQDDETLGQKRAMRNALIRFGRSGIRNALVRFGKRMSDMYFLDPENRRAAALHPSRSLAALRVRNIAKIFFQKFNDSAVR
uniref:Uncharacterized protein n=1 Tax=Onchocerca volvulus TaxID=6282 RepID=A0A8R1XTE3_ONCVO